MVTEGGSNPPVDEGPFEVGALPEGDPEGSTVEDGVSEGTLEGSPECCPDGLLVTEDGSIVPEEGSPEAEGSPEG